VAKVKEGLSAINVNILRHLKIRGKPPFVVNGPGNLTVWSEGRLRRLSGKLHTLAQNKSRNPGTSK